MLSAPISNLVTWSFGLVNWQEEEEMASQVSCIMQHKGLREVPFEEVPQNVESLDRTEIWI